MRLAVLAMVLPLLGCNVRPPPPPEVGRYSCLDLPSGFEKPGTIIRQTTTGQLFLVTDLFTEAERAASVFRVPNVQSAVARRSGRNAGSLALNLLEKLLPGVTAGISSTAGQHWDGGVVYTSLDEERTFDEPVHTLVRRWFGANPMQSGSQYFLIRDGLLARSVAMELSQQRAIESKVDAAFQSAASGTVGATLDRGATYKLDSPLNPPLYVCITRETIAELVPAGAPGGGAGPRFIAFSPVLGGDTIPRVLREQ